MAVAAGRGQGEVVWRRLNATLWVGIGADGHLGTVELGRRFTAIDADGRVRARCRTLEHATAVLEAVALPSRARSA